MIGESPYLFAAIYYYMFTCKMKAQIMLFTYCSKVILKRSQLPALTTFLAVSSSL